MTTALCLREIKTSKCCRGYHNIGDGELLSIRKISMRLSSTTKTAGKTMKRNIEKVASDLFIRLPLSFPVTRLQHVTSKTFLREILLTKSFKARSDHERPEFKDLLFWSAQIHSDDIENARLQAYAQVQHVRNADRFQDEIKEQFANSPAFDHSASRYGNFKLSFKLSDLLSLYKNQHCSGGEPQMRIFGTDIYKQEIAHYILVHSPDVNNFEDLPLVGDEQQGSFVYKIDEKLYWRPESTSISLKVDISEEICKVRKSDLPPARGKPYFKKRALAPRCVWNELVIAFHLPNQGLRLSLPDLVAGLTSCSTLQPFLGKEPMQEYEAREIVRRLRETVYNSITP
ncbi:uncharacterized protein PAF06_002937 [Gastrophryne carolinensis]